VLVRCGAVRDDGLLRFGLVFLKVPALVRCGCPGLSRRCAPRNDRGHRHKREKFFGSFFQKRTAFFFASFFKK
jgi:hypothetical protein